MIGQEEAVELLNTYLKNKSTPHALLLTGPSGCGKTTIARILADKLGCHKNDYREVDAGNKGGVEMVRALKDKIGATPMMGRVKFYVIDEAHELTRQAQEGMLKMAEECPTHVYIVLCTTDPKDLIATIMTRFTEIKIGAIAQDDLCKIIASVCEKELDGKELPPDEVIERIAEVSDGSARHALNVLGKVLRLSSVEKQLDAVQKTEIRRTSWDLVQLMLGWGQKGKKTTWQDVRKLLEGLKGQEEPEKIRRTILSCLATECLKGGKVAVRAAVMFEAFRDDFYTTGFSGLVFGCYACCAGN